LACAQALRVATGAGRACAGAARLATPSPIRSPEPPFASLSTTLWSSNKPNATTATFGLDSAASETDAGTKASRGFLSLDRFSSILPAVRNGASVVHQAHALVQLVRVCVERSAS
jgi:hypothetical protein